MGWLRPQGAGTSLSASRARAHPDPASPGPGSECSSTPGLRDKRILLIHFSLDTESVDTPEPLLAVVSVYESA